MPHRETISRNQIRMASINDYVDKQSVARIIDGFVETLDLKKYNISTATPSIKGRPAYNPYSMLKLYIYGYKNNIRSSRKLMQACKVNLEVLWLMDCAEPDFRTIALYRKHNADKLKAIFYEFNQWLSKYLEWGFTSIDGTKILANNAIDKNVTAANVDNKIDWLNEQIVRYLDEMDKIDAEEDDPSQLSLEELNEKVQLLKATLETYEGYRQKMIETRQTQLSFTDPDARLMKNKEGFGVGYNPQVAVDSNTHIIRNFIMTNNPTDHGQLYPTMENIRQSNPTEIIHITADMGYRQTEDLVRCLENGIIPDVITSNETGYFDIVTTYEECQNCNPESNDPEDLKECLHAGIIPDSYKDVISDIEITEIKVNDNDDTNNEDISSPYGTVEQMKDRAAEGYFVFDPLNMAVYCPGGKTLRKATVTKDGLTLFSNKAACHSCPYKEKCGVKSSGYKSVSFNKNILERPNKNWFKYENKEPDKTAKVKRKSKEKVQKVVKFILKPSVIIKKARKCISEHPFGTIKRTMGSYFFQMRGIKNVEGEFALSCIGYNLTRALNIFGFDKLIEIITQNKHCNQ